MESDILVSTNSFSWNSKFSTVPETTTEQILKEAAEAGYSGIEIAPERITKSLLDHYGLRLSGCSTGGDLYGNWSSQEMKKLMSTAEAGAKLGADYIFFTVAPKGGWGQKQKATEEDIKLVGERLTNIGIAVKKAGLRFLLHNHCNFSDGLEAEIHSVCDYSNPEFVGLYLDIGWAYVAGGDPVQIIEEHISKIGGFHLRNHQGVVPTETLAEGDININEIISVIKKVGYSGWVAMELWHRNDTQVTKDMFTCQKESLQFLKSLIMKN